MAGVRCALALTVTLALAGCAGLPGADWPAADAPADRAAAAPLVLPVQRPALRTGDRWIYGAREQGAGAADGRTVLERTITHVNGDRAELRQVPLDASTRRPAGPARTREVRIPVWHLEPAGRSSGEIRSLLFPLVPGKQWEYEYWMGGPGDVVTTYRYRARVEAVETVRTPAGRFEAVRVVHEGRWSRPVLEQGRPAVRSGAVTTTYWYAPAAGSWVRLEVDLRRADGTRELAVAQELLEFQRAP
ncbi:MAG: hypothetical protein KJ011_21085 [Burkholderiaceae bacterium]|nr:hypothetical protein [Burkholderiaceae bacterium]